MRRILTFLPCLLLPALLWADDLFIHENPAQAGHCYLSNRAGDKVFQGEYQTDCFAIGTSQLNTDANNGEPTDGYHTPHDLERLLLNKTASNKGDAQRPIPTVATDSVGGPEFGSVSEAAPAVGAKQAKAKDGEGASAPGFSFN